MNPTSSARQFTLIELLVVIAIISVLASMLMPALGKARDKAQISSCMNQMKQVGLGLSMYAGESDAWFPKHKVTGRYTFSQRVNNLDHLFPEYVSLDVGSCPSLPRHPTDYHLASVILAGDSDQFYAEPIAGTGYFKTQYQVLSVRREGLYENYSHPWQVTLPGATADASRRVLAADMFYGWDGSNKYTWIANSFGYQNNVAHKGKYSNNVYEDGHAATGVNPLGRMWASYAEWNAVMRAPNLYWSYHWTSLPSVYVAP